MNIISFDTEEWYIEKTSCGDRKEMYPIFDKYLDDILNILDTKGIKATFFCVGGLAKLYPNVLRKIDSKGHEIGCHSNTHVWLNTFNQEQLMLDTKDAISSIEDVIGKKVISYRAPAFSIGEKNKWALEVLAECGIERDSSIYPATRDFGGFASFPSKEPCIIKIGDHTIKEFPICLAHALGKDFAFSGGGYFRLFPLPFIKNEMRKSNYGMCYFHIDDLMHKKMRLQDRESFEEYFKIPGTLKNRSIRMIKSCIGTKGAFNKMTKLIDAFDFISLKEADRMTDWEKAQIVEI